ncbi:MAG: hypothetical protein IPN10_14910 [Saprospiraceae bacterium]|nr:hypothetical protein [Saprospiraceae bacterium]
MINSTGVRLQTGFLGSNDDEVDTSWLYSGAYQVLVRDRNGKVFRKVGENGLTPFIILYQN